MPRVSITVPDSKSQPYRFALDRKSVTLGRGSENDIVIDCSSVSVRHAIMERIEGGYELRDLGSTNGTKLNGKPRDIVSLHDGISVNIGDVAFDFSLTPEEIEVIEKERRDDQPPIIQEDAEEAPERKPAPRREAPKRPVAAAPSSSNPLITLAFIVLAAGVFFIGMSIRHQNDTGRGLIQDMKTPPPVEQEETEAEEPLTE